MRRLLDIIGDLRIAFWLLLAVAVVMWAGSIYALKDYALFNSLNGVRVQDWFTSTGWANLSSTWWIAVLFILFTLLGINTLACTAKRILAVWPKRNELPAKRFLVLLSPSIIHLLFLVILMGHFIGFTAIKQERVPLIEGTVVIVPEYKSLKVMRIEHRYFPENSLMNDRIFQSLVTLVPEGNDTAKPMSLEFLKPLYAGDTILQLDLEKKKKPGVQMIEEPKKENCNKEHQYHYGEQQKAAQPKLFIVMTKDPGLYLLIPGFVLMILVMGWYFYQVTAAKDNF